MQQHTIDVSSGLIAPESWVYVWQDTTTGEIIYVGATGLPLATRTWLHLNHEDPTIGRIRATHPEALAGEITVHGFAIDPELDRQAVKTAIEIVLAGTEPNSPADVSEVAHEIAQAIRG